MSEIQSAVGALKARLQAIGKRKDAQAEVKRFGRRASASKLKAAEGWAPPQLLTLWSTINGLQYGWRFVDEPAQFGLVHLAEIEKSTWRSARSLGHSTYKVLLVDSPLSNIKVYYLRNPKEPLEDAKLVVVSQDSSERYTALDLDLAGYLERGLACGFVSGWQLDEALYEATRARLATPALNFGKLSVGERRCVKGKRAAETLQQTRGQIKRIRKSLTDEPYVFFILDHGERFWLKPSQLMSVKTEDAYESFLRHPKQTVKELSGLSPKKLAIWWGRIGGFASSSYGASFNDSVKAVFKEYAPRYAGLLRALPLPERAQCVVNWCQSLQKIDPTFERNISFKDKCCGYSVDDYSFGDFELADIGMNLIHGFLISILGDLMDGEVGVLKEIIDPQSYEQLLTFSKSRDLQTAGLSELLESDDPVSAKGQEIWVHYHPEGDPLESEYGIFNA